MSPTNSPSPESRPEPSPASYGARRPDPGTGASVGLEQAEAAIVEHYRRLVQLAYLVLPPALGRHRRVLTAHAIAQRALPRGRSATIPAPRDTGAASDDLGYRYVRQRVLRAALDAGRPVTLAGRRLRRPRRPAALLPRVAGLRVFPGSPGAADELTMEQALSEANAPTRAAFVLTRLEGLTAEAARELLVDAEVHPALARTAVADAGELPGGTAPSLDDPCALQARPTDLLRRRQYLKAGAVLTAALALGATLLVLIPRAEREPPREASATSEDLLDPGALTRVDPDAWEDAPRLDFAVWPARGSAVDDRDLLRRALRVWAEPDSADGPVQVSATPGTATGPAAGPPQLLFAGDVAGARVVVFHDGLRLVRYGEPAAPDEDGEREGEGGGDRAANAGGANAGGGATDGGAVLDFARADGAGPDTAAVVAHRGTEGTYYLTAPWVAGAGVHDLLAPEGEPTPLPVDEQGVTGEAPSVAGQESCRTAPAVEFTATEDAARDGSAATRPPAGTPAPPAVPALMADLGELVPAALSHGEPNAVATPALAGEAAERWARTACHLPTLNGEGVRAVNIWQFAEQELPEDTGEAQWVCTRAETWRGTGGQGFVQFQAPLSEDAEAGEPAAVTARSEGGTLCGERSSQLLTGGLWRAPDDGPWFLVAAGSDAVRSISAEGEVSGREEGRTLVLPAEEDTAVQLTAELVDGTTLPALP